MVFALAIFVLVGVSFGYEVTLSTDRFFYLVNETVYVTGLVKQNSTAVSDVNLSLSVVRASTTEASATVRTNSTGYFNYSFVPTSTGNYSILANASGDYVYHYIKVKSYKNVIMSLDKSTYSASDSGVLTVSFLDASGNGVSSQLVSPAMHYSNGSLYSTLSSCTTDSLGACIVNITVPPVDGEYLIAINNFDGVIRLIVGGFEPSLKVTPNVASAGSNVTIKLIVKSPGGIGIEASGRQLLVTGPDGSEYSTTSMDQYSDASGTTVTGVYQNVFNSTSIEGTYSVKVTVTPQGSNVTRTLYGNFEVRGYSIDIVPWVGTSVFYPGSSVSLGIKLRNASSSEFVSNKATTLRSGVTIYDPSDKQIAISTDVTEYSAMNMYKLDFAIPTTARSGTYRVNTYLNDSGGSGSGNGYFIVQRAKVIAATYDNINGSIKKEFLSGNRIAAKFSARGLSGYVNITNASSYAIYDEWGTDATSLFMNRSTSITSGTNATDAWISLIAPKKGGWYILKTRLVTSDGEVVGEVGFDVRVFDINAVPIGTSGGSGACGPPPAPPCGQGGPNFMFHFKSNDTVSFSVSVMNAQESIGGTGFIGGNMQGPSGPQGPKMGGGYGGFGGGTAVSGARVYVEKIINTQTEEDVTSTTTITDGVTNSNGTTTVSLRSAVNNQQWKGGFYIVFFRANTTDNQSDSGEGFFEVRRYIVMIETNANVSSNSSASSHGFNDFKQWVVGPTDGVNVTVRVVEPGIWQVVNQSGTAQILGIYYGGGPGEFVFPPKLISGTNRTIGLTNGLNSTVISAPSNGWRSGFYLVRVSVNVSNYTDSGEGFMMSKTYEGWAQLVNPTNLNPDFAATKDENLTFQVSVFDVRQHRPAANLTVSFNKFMTQNTFPPSEYDYSGNVSTRTTDSTGRATMTIPAPSNGWSKGEYLTVFDVTNGTSSDSVDGFFMVRNFFVDMQPTRWQYGSSETVAFDVTISSDPSWMRNSMGQCPQGDQMCGRGGGQQPVNERIVPFNNGHDLDNDGQPDVNVTTPGPGLINISAIGPRKIQYKGCRAEDNNCPGSDPHTQGFESFACESLNASGVAPPVSLNASGPKYFCLQTSANRVFKIQSGPVNGQPPSNITVYFMEYTVQGNASAINSTMAGVTYYNATLSSIRVSTFNWQTGEAVIPASSYNVTDEGETSIGVGNVTIRGSGKIKLKPSTPWNGDFFSVKAEFNVSSISEFGDAMFGIASFVANCHRSSGWGPVAVGQPVQVTCEIMDPSSSGNVTNNYGSRVDINVTELRNTRTWQSVSPSLYGILPSNPYTNSSCRNADFNITTANLSTGGYDARIRLNSSSSSKEMNIWFEVKDFDPIFYSQRGTYSSNVPAELRAGGRFGNTNIITNISSATDFLVYRYDRSWTRSVVSGISLTTWLDNATNMTFLNLTPGSGWDEGQYEVIMNLSRAGSSGKVEVRTWFDVRLFNAWAWPQVPSIHRLDNMIIYAGASDPGTWDRLYNGTLTFNVTSVTNMRTGTVLVRGTNYSATSNITNLADMPLNASPRAVRLNVTSLNSDGFPVGEYRVGVRITENSTGRSVDIDMWVNVASFSFNVRSDRWDYAVGEDVSIILEARSSNGSSIQLSRVNITRADRCYQTNNFWQCSPINVSSLNYISNLSSGRVTLNTSGLSTGNYNIGIRAWDERNTSAETGFGFNLGGFSFYGTIVPPVGRDYYVNESIVVNVSGTVGANITAATIRYSLCPIAPPGTPVQCSDQSFVRPINVTLSSQNQLINITPPGTPASWYTNPWGEVWYNIDISATSGSETKNAFVSTRVRFPWIRWERIITNAWRYGQTDNITAIVNVTLDDQGAIPLANTNVSVYRLTTNPYSPNPVVINATGRWNAESNTTSTNGLTTTRLSLLGNSTWPPGTLKIMFRAVYGNAQVMSDRDVWIYTPSIEVTGKSNGWPTDNVNISNGPFNVTVFFTNPTLINATNTTVSLTSPLNSANSSVSVNNLTALSRLVSINPNTTEQVIWTFNVTVPGNYSGKIDMIPSVAGLGASQTTYGFRAIA